MGALRSEIIHFEFRNITKYCVYYMRDCYANNYENT